jgi:hypothetical protein
VNFDHSLLGQNFSAVVGRFGHKNLDYVLKRSDRTPYFSNSRWDDGKYLIDGAAFTFMVAGSSVNLFLGRTQAETFDGVDLTPGTVRLQGNNAVAGVNRLFGADTNVKLGPANLALAYVIADSDTLVGNNNQGFNQSHNRGAELTFGAAGLKFKAGLAESEIRRNDKITKTTGTMAYYGAAMYESGKFNATLGYREIQPYFATTGAWGRLGTQYSPTGFKGFYGKLNFKASDSLDIYAKGEVVEGREWNGVRGTLGIGDNDDVQSIIVGADLKLSDTFSVDASYEDVNWKLANAADPYQRWFTLGANWTLSSQASARLFWQYSDADDKGTGAFTFFGLGANKFKGSLLGSQISFKF